jgi:dihydroorotate dehydrogenase
MTIIGVGGITTAEDAAERLSAGATLLQGYTGFIYQGPFWAARIHRGLTHRALINRSQRQSGSREPGTKSPQPSGPGRREENASR